MTDSAFQPPAEADTRTAALAPPAFEECIDDYSMEWTQYATDGHHEPSPLLRKALMRAIRCYAASPGEGIAAMARAATFQQGYLGSKKGVIDNFVTDENGRAHSQWDDETDDYAQADRWWPATWGTVHG